MVCSNKIVETIEVWYSSYLLRSCRALVNFEKRGFVSFGYGYRRLKMGDLGMGMMVGLEDWVWE